MPNCTVTMQAFASPNGSFLVFAMRDDKSDSRWIIVRGFEWESLREQEHILTEYRWLPTAVMNVAPKVRAEIRASFGGQADCPCGVCP